MKAQKRCSRCRQTKPVTDFWKNRSTSDGYQTYCIECQQTYRPHKDRPAPSIFDPYQGDTHKGCGGELEPYSGETSAFVVMMCSECRMAGIPV